MSLIQTMVMRNFYRKAAGDPKRLPWHSDQPPRLLTAAVAQRNGRGRALDVGCGSGIFAAYMASQGMEVIAVDMLPEAIAMAQAVAAQQVAQVECVQADVLSFQPGKTFDLVLDSGCLHTMSGSDLPRFRHQLLRWLAPRADFILCHWGKCCALDWRPIGPRRRTSSQLQKMFSPELGLIDSEALDERVPLPFGPTVRTACYWFRRISDIPAGTRAES